MNRTKHPNTQKLASVLCGAALSGALLAPTAQAALSDFEAIQVADPNILFQYTFEGSSDTQRLLDWSGHGWDLQRTAAGTHTTADVQFVPGFDGLSQAYQPAYEFSRTSGAGLITTSTAVPVDTNATVEAIVQLDSYNSDVAVVYILAGRPTSGRAYFLRQGIVGGTTNRITSTFGGSNAAQPPVLDYTPGDWYYIALTANYDSGTTLSTVSWYGANLTAGETTIQYYGTDTTSFTGDWSGATAIGVGVFNNGTQEFMQGRMDNVALTSGILTSNDFQTRLNAILIPAPCVAAAIDSDPANQAVLEPGIASFSVSASGTFRTYQWQVSTDSGANWNNVASGTGATSSSYTTAPTSVTDSGNQYRCIVSVACVPNSVTSAVANLTVTRQAIWTGNSSTDWNVGGNWSSLLVPDAFTKATIPSGSSFVVDYDSPMAAASFLGLSVGDRLNVNAAGFTINSGGAAPLTVGAGGFVTVNSNGVVNITNSGSMALLTSSAVDVEGGSLVLSGNSGSVNIGEGTSSDNNAGAQFTNNNGVVVFDKQLVIRSRDTRFLSSGILDLQGGLNHNCSGNDSRQFFRITGGMANLNDVTINRASTSGGLSIEGGVVNSSSIRIGIGIASGYTRMTSGVWTNSGLFYVGDRPNAADSGTRRVYFRMDNGELVTTGAEGIVINNQGDPSNANLSNSGGTLDVNGGTITAEGIQLNGPNVTANNYARFELSGGTIYLGTVGLVGNTAGADMTAVFTLTGGTLAAKDDWSSTADLPLGGALTFKAADASGTPHNITLNGILSGGTGQLIKTGGGTLTLNGANSYGGSTEVDAGAVVLGPGATSASSSIYVAAGATYDASAPGGVSLTSGQSLAGSGVVAGLVTAGTGTTIIPGSSIGTLTLSNGLNEVDGVFNDFELSSSSNDVIHVVGDLTLSGLNTVSITPVGGVLASNAYTLISYTGNLFGDVSSLQMVGAPGYLTNNASAKAIMLVTTGIRAATNVTWIGNAIANDWDVLNSTNWLLGGALASFVQGDDVLFDNTGLANPNVNIAESVSPGSITVNSTGDYAFSGPGSIGGSGGLTKTNSGVLTLSTNNAYTGVTTINGGVLKVPEMANGSANSSIGASSPDSANLVIDGGTLEYIGTTQASDRGATIGATGGTIAVSNVTESLGLSGAVTGPGTLNVSGAGTLILAGGNSYGGANLASGVLQINTSTAALAGAVTFNGGSLRLNVSSQQIYSNPIDVSTTGTLISAGGNNNVVDGDWSGSGILNLDIASGTFTINDALSTNFNGAFVVTSNSTGAFRFNGGGNATGPQQCNGSALVAFDLGDSSATLGNRNGGGEAYGIYDLGSLSGGSMTKLHGNLSSASGDQRSFYSIGAKNLSTVFEGVVENGNHDSTSIIKVGSGTLTLSGVNTYTGDTIINSGTLALSTNSTTFGDGSIDYSTNITVAAGAVLDVLGRTDDSLQLGAVTAGQTLKGGGTLIGTLLNYGVVSPGSSVGTLTINGPAYLYGTTLMELNTANGAQTNDVLACANITGGGVLTLTNIGPRLKVGQYFKLFSTPVTVSGMSINAMPDADGSTYTFTDNTMADGSVTVATANYLIATDPTNIVASVNGNMLTLTWPESHTGWTLQAQTNNLATGLTGTWTDVPNSELQNSYSTTIDTANPTVFYRLMYLVP